MKTFDLPMGNKQIVKIYNFFSIISIIIIKVLRILEILLTILWSLINSYPKADPYRSDSFFTIELGYNLILKQIYFFEKKWCVAYSGT